MSISKLNCTLEKLSLATAITFTALTIATPVSSQEASFIGDRADVQANERVKWFSLKVTSTFKVLPHEKLE